MSVTFTIRELRREDVPQAAALHERVLHMEFLARCGGPFLRRYYRAWATSPGGIAVVAVVVFFVVQGWGTSGAAVWGPGQSRTFDLSRVLPTGSGEFNGQFGCGANQTVNVTLPGPAVMYYNASQNESGASVNVWISVGNPGFQNAFLSTGEGRISGEIGYPYVETFHFTFMACGPGASVGLGFWGTVEYSTSFDQS